MKKGKRSFKRRSSTLDNVRPKRHDTGAVSSALIDNPEADVLLKEVIQEMDAMETETGSKVYLYVKTPSGQEMKFESRNLNKQYKTSLEQTDTSNLCTSKATQTPCSTLQGDADGRCALCHNPRGGTEDKDMGPWIGCYACDCLYWSHFRCQGFRATEEDVEEMKKDGDIIFYCPKHR